MRTDTRTTSRTARLARTLTGLCALTLLAFATAPSVASAAPIVWPKTALVRVAGGFSKPLYAASAGDGSGRVFVVEKTGRIRVIKRGKLLAAAYLDLSKLVSGGSEQGLLGLAFAPGFATNGRFYVNYTDRAGNTVVARYAATPSADVAKATSGRTVLTVKQPYANHNGGCLQFGPDGMLYVGMGDGGSGGDPGNRAQNKTVLLGKMLRIDAEGAAKAGLAGYRIPANNPYYYRTAIRLGWRSEIWQLGLRNPWRFSFDRATGDMYIGDVGQDAWEEVDFTPKAKGGQNFGWHVWEGNHPYPVGAKPSRVGFTFPVAEVAHPDAEALIGGYVYRGTARPAWQGTYFYADEVVGGKLWAMKRDPGGVWRTSLIQTTGHTISSFGQDQNGELYVTDLADGGLYRITAGK
jgi:glucose/arabinose dehydrogenase